MELEKLTALQLGEKIKQRQVSVLDGVKTVFEQIEKQDSEVHAYLDTYKEEAYKRAEEVQKGIEDGTYTSPLAGVPIAIKDNICINGKKTTCASKILENFVPQYNAEVIDRLEKAGLVEGKDYTVDYQNAGFDDNTAIQIGQNFASKNVKLMVGIATPMAQACYNAAGDIPTIFTAICDPVSAGFAEADGKAVGEDEL